MKFSFVFLNENDKFIFFWVNQKLFIEDRCFVDEQKGFLNGKTEKGGPGNRKKFEWNLIALNHRKYFRWE